MIPQQVRDATSLVRAASPVVIENCLKEVVKRMRRYKRWLNTDHPYNGDIIETLKQQRNAASIDAPKLGEYIACSAPLHLADGWNYLSRAFDAASRGDRNVAQDLAYYAELRAAMSLLATEGIGIFDSRHIALDDHLHPSVLNQSTHMATWLVLSAWSNEPGRAVRLLEAITIESRSLSEWLKQVGVVAPAQQLLANKWLQAWSIDLKILGSDRFRRNEMSYRPTRIRVPVLPSVNPRLELIDPLFDSWMELEPTAGEGSAALDFSLLREAIRLVVKEGRSSYPSLGKALGSLKSDMPPFTYQALSTESPSASAIFRAAEVNDAQSKTATPILARSLLMLRLASASTASLLRTANVSKSDLEFWWSPLGTDLGLWDQADDIETFSDLWVDVADAKNEADDRISDIRGDFSVRAVAGILARDVSLTQFSRASMWLLGLD